MKQPSKRKRKIPSHIEGTGVGVDTCNECPFMLTQNGISVCNASDMVLGNESVINVPDWCGNKKGYEKGIQGKK